MQPRRSVVLPVALAIAVVTGLVQWMAVWNGIVNWDDDLYLSVVRQQGGLTGASVWWAFTHALPFYYHPLTWLSHFVDFSIWGMNPAGHHAGNVLLHCANAGLVVVFVWLLLKPVKSLAAGEKWALAAGTALVFGIHPLQVESVAWIAERKNVLCGFFCLASLCAYLQFVLQKSAWRWYWLSAGLFVAALLSKPMAVSLPVVMLAMDFCPLRRHITAGWRRLLAEKAVFFALSIALAGVTFWAQHEWGAVAQLEQTGVVERLLVAVRGSVFYLWKLVWPAWLSPYYPLGGAVSLANKEFLVPVILFVIISVVSIWLRKSAPAVVVIWVTYLAWLAPASGLVQVGSQAVADRFVYLAIVPVVLGSGWVVVWCWRNVGVVGRGTVFVLLIFEVVFLSVRARQQSAIWRDEESFWRTVLAHFPESGVGNFHLAMALVSQRRFDEALPHAQQGVAVIGENPLARSTLGVAYLKTRHFAEAVPELQEALRLEPEFWASRYNLACAYSRLGKLTDAYETLRELLARQPQYAGMAARDGELAALRADPAYAEKFAELLRAAAARQ